MSNNISIILTSLSVTVVVFMFCLVLYIKKNIELINKKVHNKIRRENRQKVKIYNKNIKIFCLKIFAFLSVELTCGIDLYARQLINDSKHLNKFIVYCVENGIMVLICMVIFSYFMRVIIKRTKLLHKNETTLDSIKNLMNDNYNYGKKFEEMIIYAYKFAIIIIIIMLLIMGNLSSAINWGIILGGKYIWFGIFDIMPANQKEKAKLYTFERHDVITYSILALFTIPIIASIQYQFNLISNILYGIGYGLIISSVVTYISWWVLIRKRKSF